MKTEKIGNYSVEIYDAIEDLPMNRFHRYNKMLLVDSGIGSDLTDYDNHIDKTIAFIRKSDSSSAIQELENTRQNIYFIQSGLSPKHLAFAVLIKSIDGEPQNDLSNEGLQKILDLFSDVPQNVITALSEAVKKKIDQELQLYFPANFDDGTIKEYYDELRKRTLLILGTIINGESSESEKEIEEITWNLLTYNKPHIFSGTKNAEIQHDKNFENMCLMISQKLHQNPKDYTVLQFYNSFEYIKEMLKSQNKK